VKKSAPESALKFCSALLQWAEVPTVAVIFVPGVIRTKIVLRLRRLMFLSDETKNAAKTVCVCKCSCGVLTGNMQVSVAESRKALL